VGAALVVGLLAGLLPAGRAARLAPADALRL
jgi:ABC-type antimicrobial peptide transport system permease subunit